MPQTPLLVLLKQNSLTTQAKPSLKQVALVSLQRFIVGWLLVTFFLLISSFGIFSSTH